MAIFIQRARRAAGPDAPRAALAQDSFFLALLRYGLISAPPPGGIR
ncbi:hypothetical protein [Pseudogemmobacter faecipullorum]|uniref:Uncharacterized protein n=1 Tax=Pseudogemmobacter faecipullorum TaxID=2755041 RepID=A0ABS8CMF2_9RHOB|nr:hypothetical protein [Pseudogemmobacter faecipullorum]MCB5410582.1 hypothetical protein [Pseudogemmobacter faecipullorum]